MTDNDEQDRDYQTWNKAILIAALAVWVIIWAVAYWSMLA